MAKGPLGSERIYEFPIDSTVESLNISAALTTAQDAEDSAKVVPGATIRVRDPSGNELALGQPGVQITTLRAATLFRVNKPAAGVWRVVLNGPAAFNFDLAVTANSPIELNRFQFVKTGGRAGHTGLFPIKSQPLAGVLQESIATLFGASGSAEFELINEAGNLITTLPGTRDPASMSSDQWYGKFLLPSQSFRVRAKGLDASGKAYMRVYEQLFSGRTVKVEVFGDALGRFTPGSTSSIRFVITNLGSTDKFTVTAQDQRGYVGSLVPIELTLGSNESQIIQIPLTVPLDAAVGTINNISFTATGASTANGTVVTQVVSARTIPGDLDGDGDIDRDDVGIVFSARGQTALSASDPRDLDGDGKITALDSRKAMQLCTRPGCRRE
ncbi:MAG: hypothetical protein HEQ39_16240 [Rhizobacter sp.]